MNTEIKLGKSWLAFGYTFSAFNLGIIITSDHLELNLGFVWISYGR